MNDSTPIYQGTVVPHEIIINAGFGGTTTSAHWEPVIEKMGSRGWELACILETPESHISGMASIARKCLLFFQRRILPPVGVAPGAIGFNLPPPPPYDSMPAGYGQVQPGLYQPPPPPPEYKWRLNESLGKRFLLKKCGEQQDWTSLLSSINGFLIILSSVIQVLTVLHAVTRGWHEKTWTFWIQLSTHHKKY